MIYYNVDNLILNDVIKNKYILILYLEICLERERRIKLIGLMLRIEVLRGRYVCGCLV